MSTLPDASTDTLISSTDYSLIDLSVFACGCDSCSGGKDTDQPMLRFDFDEQSVQSGFTLKAKEVLSPAPPRDTVLASIQGNRKWGLGSDRTLTYFFADHLKVYKVASNAWTDSQKATFKLALDKISEVANIKFKEVFSKKEANLVETVGSSKYLEDVLQFSGVVGYHDGPSSNNPGYSLGGYNTEYWKKVGGAPGKLYFENILHEVGHALGLHHPHSGEMMKGVRKPRDLGLHELNQGIHTVMTYNFGYHEKNGTDYLSNYYSKGMMALDIAALQSLYGANTTGVAANKTFYNVHDIYSTGGFESIWSVNKITLSADPRRGTVVDLRAATLKYEEGGGGFLSYVKPTGIKIIAGYTIAAGVVADKARGGSGNDDIYLNSANNKVYALGGHDTIYTDGAKKYTDGGIDYIDGGDGQDTVYLGHSYSDYLVVKSRKDRTIELLRDKDKLTIISEVETVIFDPRLPLSPSGVAESYDIQPLETKGRVHLYKNSKNDAYILKDTAYSHNVILTEFTGANENVVSVSKTTAPGWKLVRANKSPVHQHSYEMLFEKNGQYKIWKISHNGYVMKEESYFPPAVLKIGHFGRLSGGWTTQNDYPRMFADVNGDGAADFVAFGYSFFVVYLNDGGGNFSYHNLIRAFAKGAGEWTSQERYPRTLADIDGDGDADIVGFGDNRIFIAPNDGNGTFVHPGSMRDPFGGTPGGWNSQNNTPRFLSDVDGDGDADIIGFGRTGTFVAENNGDWTFQKAQSILTGFGTSQNGTLNETPRLIGDIDGDGDDDIVVLGYKMSVIKNDGKGGFTIIVDGVVSPFHVAGLGNPRSGPGDAEALADIDGDGKADLISFDRDGVYVAGSNGDGTFRTAVQVSEDFNRFSGWHSYDNINPRTAADLNADGRADLVGFGDKGLFVALNNNSDILTDMGLI